MDRESVRERVRRVRESESEATFYLAYTLKINSDLFKTSREFVFFCLLLLLKNT